MASFGGGFTFDAASRPAEAPVQVRLVEVKSGKANVIVEAHQALAVGPEWGNPKRLTGGTRIGAPEGLLPGVCPEGEN